MQGGVVSVVGDGGEGGACCQGDEQVVARDPRGLLRDISAMLTNEGVDLTGVKAR